MSETRGDGQDWGDLEGVPVEKRGIPRWLLFCGGSCLVALVLAIIGTVLVWRFVQKAVDEERQYPALEEHVALDHRLPDYQLWGFDVMGEEGYMFIAKDQSRTAVISVADDEAERAELDALFDPARIEESNPMGEFSDAEVGTIVVQGRELSVARATMQQSNFGFGRRETSGSAAFVDITPEGAAERVVLFYVRSGSKERIPDEDIVEFLRPFHIGPDRVPSEIPEDVPAEIDAPGEVPPEQDDDGR